MNQLKIEMSHPPEWEFISIEKACALVSRGTAPSYVNNSEIFAIGQRCVRESGFQPHEARFHDQRLLERVLRAQIGDVLLNSTGTGTIGRACVFDSKGDYVVDGHVTVLRPNPTMLDAHWLNAILESPEGQLHLERQCYSGSTNQVELSRSRLIATCFPLPSITEQRRISEIFDTIDEAIQKTEALIAKLKAMKQGLLHDLLTRGLNEEGKLRDFKAHPEQFKDSPLGKIPKEWQAYSIKSLISFITDYRGKTPPHSSSGIPVITAENVIDGEIKNITKYVTNDVYRKWTTRGFHKPGDIIITTEAPVGEVAQAPDFVCLLTRRVIGLRPFETLVQERYLYWHLYWVSTLGSWQPFTHGSTVPRILKPDLLARRILLPEIEEQRKIIRLLDDLNERLKSEKLYGEKLKLQKKGLMHDLLTGKVRVRAKEKSS